MSDTQMQVELVAADRLVWSGEATMVIARTTEGDVGILPNHAPMLSTMVHGIVDVTTSDNETWIAAVDAGFLSVANNRISIADYFGSCLITAGELIGCTFDSYPNTRGWLGRMKQLATWKSPLRGEPPQPVRALRP